MADSIDPKFLHDILAALRGIRDDVHSVAEKQKATKDHPQKDRFIVDLDADSRLPPSVGKYYESQNRKWKSVWEKIKVGIEVAGFAGAIIAAIYSYRTFGQIKRQADIAHDQWSDLRHNFMVEERAWLTFKYPSFPEPIPPKTIIDNWAWRVTNVGKSPAMNIRVQSVFEIVEKDHPPSFDFSQLHFITQSTTVFPNDGFDIQIPLGPFSNPPRQLSEADIKNLEHGSSYLAAFSQVTYKDQFGSHWTRLCAHQAFAPGDYNADSCVYWSSTGDGTPPKLGN